MTGYSGLDSSRRVRGALGAVVAACAVAAVLPGAASASASAPAAPQTSTWVERVSVAADGSQANGSSVDASITPSGRHVVFSSSASNLTGDSAAGSTAVFVRDRQAGQNLRQGDYTPIGPPSVSGDGAYAGYALQWMRNVRIRFYQVATGRTVSADCSAYSCTQPVFNADGRYVALSVLRYSSSYQTVEVHDQDTWTKQTVANLPHTSPARPSISGDGRYVAYQDALTKDVFVRDMTAGTVTGPVEGAGVAASLVQLSDDGSKVVYQAGTDTYVHDLAAGTSQLVPGVKGVAIDPTGRHLLHSPHPGAAGPSLTLRDLVTGTDSVVSDQPATAGTDSVTAGGGEVVFQSAASDLVTGDTNGAPDVFVRHFD
jgi:hypothetical protein